MSIKHDCFTCVHNVLNSVLLLLSVILQSTGVVFGQSDGVQQDDDELRIEKKPDEQLDLLIVVDQMLTGFDSKWINTLYLDKVLEYEHLIQAFSRTNRLFGLEKPFGTIRYYRYPHTMEQNVRKAVGLYSGDRPMGLFASKLEDNLRWADDVYGQIRNLFAASGIEGFDELEL